MATEKLKKCCICGTTLSNAEAIPYLRKTWCLPHYGKELGLSPQPSKEEKFPFFPPEQKSASEEKVILKAKDPKSTLERYPTLQFLSSAYRSLAAIIGGLALIGLASGLNNLEDSPYEGTVLIIVSIVGGAIGVVSFLALAESIKLGIDIEQNTRESAEQLRKLKN